jgi:tetratricopeptide (TPR) repeat protein
MKLRLIITAVLLMIMTLSCSINKMAVRMLSSSLSEGSQNVFTSDNDPELVGESLPFVLKMYEILIDADPENDEMLSTAGQGFITYANIYVHMPADMMEYSEWKKQSDMYTRAKKLYMRGSGYSEKALSERHKGFSEAVAERHIDELLPDMEEEDVADLYWFGMGIMGALSIDITDPYLAPMRNTAVSAIMRGFELENSFNNGAFHDFFVQYYSSLPDGMGGGLDKAEYHYNKALELSNGTKASPYVSYALAVCTKLDEKKGVDEFKKTLEKALMIDENIVFKWKAQWLLENIDNYFLID